MHTYHRPFHRLHTPRPSYVTAPGVRSRLCPGCAGRRPCHACRPSSTKLVGSDLSLPPLASLELLPASCTLVDAYRFVTHLSPTRWLTLSTSPPALSQPSHRARPPTPHPHAHAHARTHTQYPSAYICIPLHPRPCISRRVPLGGEGEEGGRGQRGSGTQVHTPPPAAPPHLSVPPQPFSASPFFVCSWHACMSSTTASMSTECVRTPACQCPSHTCVCVRARACTGPLVSCCRPLSLFLFFPGEACRLGTLCLRTPHAIGGPHGESALCTRCFLESILRNFVTFARPKASLGRRSTRLSQKVVHDANSARGGEFPSTPQNNDIQCTRYFPLLQRHCPRCGAAAARAHAHLARTPPRLTHSPASPPPPLCRLKPENAARKMHRWT